MNRQKKRKMLVELRNNSQKVAAVMAANSYDYTSDGVPILISNPIAIKALERGYIKFFKNNCRLSTEQISFKESQAFPRNKGVTEQACSVLAIGEDIEGHLVYGLKYCDATTLHISERYEIARRAAIEETKTQCKYGGFPMDKLRFQNKRGN